MLKSKDVTVEEGSNGVVKSTAVPVKVLSYKVPTVEVVTSKDARAVKGGIEVPTAEKVSTEAPTAKVVKSKDARAD